MPLASGYSQATIAKNVATMRNEGYPQDQAIAAAYDKARASFFKRFPSGFMPAWLALPGGRRDRKGWEEWTMREKNPVPPSRRVQVRDAVRLYEDFSGNDAEEVVTIDKPEMPDVVLVIGELDFVGYTTNREGRKEKYIHEFKQGCRPLLCATPDGKNLVLLGGRYTFTERGIVDAR